MPNPKGNLAGWSDREIPGWQDRALERVRERQAKSGRTSERKNGIYMFFDDPFRVLLDEAAKRRNISLAGYCRRAVGAFIARDLGLPIAEVLQHTAVPLGYLTFERARTNKKTMDDGKGRGPWVIAELEDAE